MHTGRPSTKLSASIRLRSDEAASAFPRARPATGCCVSRDKQGVLRGEAAQAEEFLLPHPHALARTALAVSPSLVVSTPAGDRVAGSKGASPTLRPGTAAVRAPSWRAGSARSAWQRAHLAVPRHRTCIAHLLPLADRAANVYAVPFKTTIKLQDQN